MENVLTIIPAISAVAAAAWGIYVFNKQQRFKRLLNLSQIFQRFADARNGFFDVFSFCDQAYEPGVGFDQIILDDLMGIPVKRKLQYLALPEEAALYASYSEVDRKYAIHLFQWHFCYVYANAALATAFWFGLGGVSEKEKPYWEYQKHISSFYNRAS